MSRARRIANIVLAAVAAVGLLVSLGIGVGPVPALGPALNPDTGVWASAANGTLPHSQTLDLAGLTHPVEVTFTADGLPSINAASDTDVMLGLGYLHAQFRFGEMDLERRLGAGRLSELVGPSGLDSDKFELQLGLLRTAQEEWRQIGPDSPTGKSLLAYADGVNDWLARARSAHSLPATYALLGVQPADWTPVDSLVVQEVLTQNLNFTTTPLQYAILAESLGAERARALFPVIPSTDQVRTDPGPYRDLGVAPFDGTNVNVARPASFTPGPNAGGATGSTELAPPPVTPPTGPTAVAAAALIDRINKLPVSAVHRYADSNAWAANGPKVAGAKAILGGDPHLQTTLPAIWYQAALHSPGYDVTGVSLPGVPGILIGRNKHISWSITNVSNQSTLYYQEKTSSDHPGQYFWKGAWRDTAKVDYTIPVNGSSPVGLTVELTVHGPIMTQDGQTMAVNWMGDIPAPGIEAMLAVDRSSDFTEFRTALRSWRAPTQNFVYADDQGHIGSVSPGYYPLVAKGDPWAPLPGTGEYDVVGTIPYDAVPQVFDPPSHVIVSANQRPVGPEYPYYIGTSMTYYDYGYRAHEIADYLNGHDAMTAEDFTRLQNSTVDNLARRMVPALLSTMDGGLSPQEQQVRALLADWNYSMDVSSPAASVWWTFWGDYLSTVFQPWWDAAKVPVARDKDGLSVSPGQASLDQDLEQWTLTDPGNAYFSLPDGTKRTAKDAMRAAFTKTVADLSTRLGPDPAAWTWGKLHSRQLTSLNQAQDLGYGPFPAPGDSWTVNAAAGSSGKPADWGPSWRMVISWTGQGQGTGQAIYPGGQSEDPSSPWYQTFVDDWWSGRYRPLHLATEHPTAAITWMLRPGGSR